MPVVVKRALATGGITGFVVVYLCVVGMVEKFEIRNLVGSEMTLGRLLLFLPLIVGGALVVRPRIEGGELKRAPLPLALAAGGATGAVAGLVMFGAIALARTVGIEATREIFVAVSPGLIETVQFGDNAFVALVVWLAGGAAAAALGAALRAAPPEPVRALTSGLSAVLLVALLQRILPPAMNEVGLSSDWLFSRITRGLTVTGAVIVFVAAAGLSALWRRRREAVGRSLAKAGKEAKLAVSGGAFLLLAGFLFVLPNLIGNVLTNALGTVGIFLLMGIGLNIVVGYAGLLDLGYVAFFAVGAYFTALFTGARTVSALGAQTEPVLLTLDFWTALPLVILTAAFVGLLIGAPVLRLRGDYLAIVTLGFGEIARVLVTSNWLRDVVGGAQGLQGIPTPPGFTRDARSIYYLVVIFVFAALFVSKRLADSRIGRAWNAMREDEQVAEAMGISTTRYKLLAFAMGAAIGCLSGALFAVKLGSLTPISFGILVSITALAVIILGGIGSLPGVVVGSLVLIGLPELLTEFEEFRLLIYGAVLTTIMILRPGGLVPNVRRSAEVGDQDRAQDKWLDKARAAAAAEGAEA